MKVYYAPFTIKKLINSFIKSPYHNSYVMGILFVAAAHFIVAIGSDYGFLASVKHPDYPYAFLFSFFVAGILSIYIHTISLYFDGKYPWQQILAIRFFLQMVFGVLIPSFMEYLFASGFFSAKGEDIMQNTFTKVDFNIAIAYIITLNGFYTYANIQDRNKVKAIEVFRAKMKRRYEEEIMPELDELAELRHYHRQKSMKDAANIINDETLKRFGIAKTDLAFLCKNNGYVTAVNFDCGNEILPLTLKEYKNKLEIHDYFMINANCIIHRLLIRNVEEITSRKCRLLLRSPFLFLQSENHIETSQRVHSAFRFWYVLDH